MNKRFLVLVIAFVFAGSLASGQVKQADKLFMSYSYSSAIPYYLKIAQQRGARDRNYAIVRLADCYRLVNDQLNAKTWYARAVKLPNNQSINWFYYGEALRCAQDYTLAKEAFEKYAALNPDDPRGKAYAAFCSDIDRLNKIPAGYEIKAASILNSKGSDFGAVFYDEGIIFVSDRRQNFMDNNRYEWTNFNYLDLFYTSPRYIGEFFGEMNEPKAFTGKFNQTYHDGPASFGRHDSLIYFTRTEKGKEKKDNENFRTNKLKIFWSQLEGSWSNPKEFFMNSPEYSVGHPVLTPDGNTLYFVSDMPGGMGGTDIYSCIWEDGQWSQPFNLGTAINSFGNEMFPSLHGDQLYFASNGWAGFGGLDIFKSTLVGENWTKAENLGKPVNSSFDDFAMVLDTRGKTGFISSNRPGGMGGDDLYAIKISDIKPKSSDDDELLAEKLRDSLTTVITGFVKDKHTLKPMARSTVFLLNAQTDKVEVIKTDENGQFKARVDKGVFYVVKGMENNYLSDCFNFKIQTTDTSHLVKTPRDLLLDLFEVNKIFSINESGSDADIIYYDFDKWVIRPDAAKELDKLVQIMKENPVLVEIGSHTDSRGSSDYNLELSQKRAESAVRYIVLQGIEANRISAKGYGESKIMNHCSNGVPCTPAEHQANRRSVFKVTGITNTESGTKYDMQKFEGNEEIPVYLFDRDFFINCLPDKRKFAGESNGDSGKGIANPQPGSKPNANEVKQDNTRMYPSDEVVNTGKGALTYRVQLYALSRELSLLDPEFEILDDVQMYVEDGLYKYTSGVFNTHDEAINYRSKMVRLGYSDSFVVTFSNGKRVYLSPSH